MSSRRVDPPVRGRDAVLATLSSAGDPLTIAAVAEALGVHPNTVRFHLETLLEHGQVERVAGPRQGPGRPPQLFRAVRAMDPGGPRRYRLLAELLVQALASAPDATERALAVGHEWGLGVPEPEPSGDAEASDDQAPQDPDLPLHTDDPLGHGSDRAVGAVAALLADLGFAPQVRTEVDTTRIELRRCPFLELARRAPHVVCPVHLGIVRGATEAWEAPITATGLEPFAEPDVCVLHLGPRTAA